MTQADATTVRRQVVVNAPQAQAFAAFTGRFGDFKSDDAQRVAPTETPVKRP